MSESTTLLDLEDDVLALIFSLGSYQEVLNWSQCCKLFDQIANDHLVWRALVTRDFPKFSGARLVRCSS